MPNWCINKLMIRGESEEVQKLLDSVVDVDTALSLNKIITRPEELSNVSAPQRDEEEAKRLNALYGAPDWYQWSIENWGTKWDVEATIDLDTDEVKNGYETYAKPGMRTVRMVFDSAWSPPVQAIDLLAKKFPNTNLYLSYDETGCDFSGYRMYSQGECIKQKETTSLEVLRQYIEPSEDIFDYFPN